MSEILEGILIFVSSVPASLLMRICSNHSVRSSNEANARFSPGRDPEQMRNVYNIICGA
jgi:hypothetical protein